MNRASFRALQHRTSSGVTLIELMIAMVLGLLVAAGIITVFLSTSRSNQVQAQMARLQEEGRFAIGQVSDSLRMAGASYCSGSGGAATQQGALYVDGLRSPTVVAAQLTLADNTTPFDSTGYPATPTSAYSLPSYLYMRGYDCGKNGTCTPVDPHGAVAGIPAPGSSVGARVVGSDVLTIRYLDGNQGWSIGSDDVVHQTGFSVDEITIAPAVGEPALDTVASGDLMMYGDCSNAHVFAAARSGGVFTVGAIGPNAGNNMATFPANLSADSPTKLFDFSNAFKTVTWYLQVVDDGSAAGHVTGALMRRVNGAAAEEVVRGVERLDFLYGVEDNLGNTRYLSADDIDAGLGANCPKQPPAIPLNGDAGCLWRAVQTIEVSMLVDGQQPLPTLEDSALAYAYSPDSSSPMPPDDASHAVKYSDQGFQRGLLRREFNALVSVRNFNP